MRTLLLFFAFPLFAVFVGNPSNPAIMNSGFFSSSYLLKGTSGYIYDYTSNKRYHAPQKGLDFNPNATFKEFGMHSQMGSFSMVLLERLELFGAAGGSKEQAKGKTHPSVPFEFKSDYQFSWCAGAKAVFLKWGQTTFSGDFTYFTIPSSTKSFFKYLDQFDLPIEFGQKQPTSLKEWQWSLALSSRFSFLSPYFGGTYLYSKLHIDSSSDTPAINYENENKWGYFFGITLSATGKFHINLERRLENESGYTLSTIAVF